MKRALFFFFLFFIHHIFAKEEILWLTDLEKAKQVGKRQKKIIIVVLQDQSSWSKKMEKIFSDPVFSEGGLNFTFCKLAESKENDLPKIVMMHPKDGVIAKMGYLPLHADEVSDFLLAQVENYEQIKQVALNAKNYNSKQIEKAYLLSKEVGCEAFTQKLFEEGLQCLDTAFFAFEKYEELSEKFSPSDERVKSLRAEVINKDPKNIQNYHLRLAVLDFYHLAKMAVQPEVAIAPLLEYIGEYGSKDRENIWKVHMTISQYYLGKKDFVNSLKYARLSYKKAPRSVKTHIQLSIKYLRRKVNTRKR